MMRCLSILFAFVLGTGCVSVQKNQRDGGFTSHAPNQKAEELAHWVLKDQQSSEQVKRIDQWSTAVVNGTKHEIRFTTQSGSKMETLIHESIGGVRTARYLKETQ